VPWSGRLALLGLVRACQSSHQAMWRTLDRASPNPLPATSEARIAGLIPVPLQAKTAVPDPTSRFGDPVAGGECHDGGCSMAHAHEHAQVTSDRRRLAAALALVVGFMVVEVVVGALADSLALLSDAAHMLTDAGALALALVAARLATRPAEGGFTFGLRRAEILSAQVNGATLVAFGALIVFEGVRRLISPPDVEGAPVLAVALAGVVVNLAAARLLSGADRRSLNVEGAFQHVLTDLFAFLATAVAGAVILATDFGRADGIAALLVAALMLRAGFGLLRDSGRVLLEAAPRGLDPEDIGRALAEQPHVVEVHDLHVWEVTSGFPSLSAHVLVRPDCDPQKHRYDLAELLRERFGIEHTTLQVEYARAGAPLTIEPLKP
jgi:cobalt-zinc-cadmium efflux system protein